MQNYIGSLLADIAYLDLNVTNFIDGKLTNTGADARGFNEQDRLYFNEHFTIIDQSTPDGLLSSGFSGSTILCVSPIIENNEVIMESNFISIAYRGTESVGDFVTDLELALRSSAALAVTFDDFVKRLIAGNVSTVEISIFKDKISSFENNKYISIMKRQREDALNYFSNVTGSLPNTQINVYGHSLGGYLANYVTTVNNNYQNIKETITFNAPGFDRNQLEVINIIQKIETIIKEPENNTFKDIINDMLKTVVESLETVFNINSLNKLHSIYSTTGLEFTTSDQLGMFHPELRIPLYTDDAGMVSNHFVRYLREALCVYDSLSCLMPGDKLKNYDFITEILTSFTKDFLINSNFKAIDETLKHMSVFLGITSSKGIEVLNFMNSLSLQQLLNYNVNKFSEKTINDAFGPDGKSILYSLINYIPFTITGGDNINDNLYNPEMYTNDLIKSRFYMFEKLMSTENEHIYRLNNSEIEKLKFYKVFYDEKGGSDFAYIDAHNEFIYTNNLDIFKGLNNYLKTNAKITYFSDGSTLIIDTLNNIIYDYFEDDYIALNKGETTLDLSYGSDTVMIDVAAGATIKDVTIKDKGLGDLFIFNGGKNSDFIKGTKYKDKILGAAGEDHLFGDDGDDTINGGLGNDMIFGENGDDTLIGDDGDDHLMGGAGSNSLSGGAGDDILNAYNTLNEYHDIRGDYLTGGSGNNTLFGTGYGDTYTYHGEENGVDTIYEKDNNFGSNYIDRLIFTAHTQSSEVLLYNILNNLVIVINGINRVFVIDYYDNHYSYLDEIQFTNVISGEKIIWNTQYIIDHTINKKDGITTGTAGDDVLQGDDNIDQIYGGEGNDTIRGGKGDDIIHGGNGNDTIYGDDGNDVLNGNEGNDTVYGGNGIDIINGDNGDDKLYGDAGDDFIYGGEGADTIFGGLDNDTIFGGNGNDTINGDSGNDTIHGDNGNDTITGGIGNDIIYGDDGDDMITSGSSGTNELDKLYGGNGNDTISNSINNTYIRGGNDNDILFTSGINFDIDGESGADLIYMGTGSGYLKGGNGADIFYNNTNGVADYIIEGGLDDDTINMVKNGNHTIIYNKGDGNDRIIINGTNSNTQTDTIRLNGYSKNNIKSSTMLLFDNGKSLKLQLGSTDSISLVNFLTATSSINNIKYFQFDDGTLTNKDLIDIFTSFKGTDANDTFYDSPFEDTFDMNETGGNDYLYLKSGFDVVYSGTGNTSINLASSNNTIYSGSGNDYITLNSNYSNIVNLKNSNNGHDTISVSIFATGSKTILNLLNTINISHMNKGSYSFSWDSNSSITFETKYLNNQIMFNNETINLENLDLIGDSRDNYLKALSDRSQYIRGNGGIDEIYGGNGNDHIFGGTGDDKLYGEGGDDIIYGDEGKDFIFDILGGNTIWGGDDDDTITTGAGKDTIYGGNGNDTINSGIGADIVYGGDGDDNISGHGGFYYGEDGNDTYGVSNGHIVDYSGYNTLKFGTDYRDNVTIYKTGTGFNISISGKNGVNNITYIGEISRIERSYMLPDGYTYKDSLVVSNSSNINEINRLFELQASLVNETDETKITQMRTEISNLWGYDKP